MLFDTHAHLDDHAFDDDRAELMKSLPEKNLRYVMNPACSMESSYRVVELVRHYDWLYGAVGCHPDAANEVNDHTIQELKQLCEQNSKIIAIGEIGLDYHYEDIPREKQQETFRAQLELAEKLSLPVIVHDRDAHEDSMRIIRNYPNVTGVFHCYSGSLEMARELIKMGWYVGFTGVLTFKNARKSVEVAAGLPHDRIVLETDCPYMAPEPFRGRRNDPGYLYRMAEKLAEIWGVSAEEAAEITLNNGKKLYRLN